MNKFLQAILYVFGYKVTGVANDPKERYREIVLIKKY